MAQIGTMTGTAGAVTSLNLPYCPEYLIVGDTYTGSTFELSNFTLSIDSIVLLLNSWNKCKNLK